MTIDNGIRKSLKDILSDYFYMDDNIVADVERHAKMVRVRKGETVVRQGEVCHHIFFILHGLMRVVHRHGEEEDTFLFGSVGDVFTSLHSYQKGKPAVFAMESLTEGEILIIAYNDWRKLEDRHPQLIKWMRDCLLVQLYSFEDRYLRYNVSTAVERFSKFLEMDRKDIPNPSVRLITRHVPIKYLASYLKMSRWTLSRLRNKLVRKERTEDF